VAAQCLEKFMMLRSSNVEADAKEEMHCLIPGRREF
jgi:hypothetical protein